LPKEIQIQLYTPHAGQMQLHSSDARFRICATGRRFGKPEALDSKLLTPSGWKLMRHIHVGDFVIGSNGKGTKVIALHPQGEVDIYKVTFSDGGSAECGWDHLWAVQTRWQREKSCTNKDWQVKPLSEIAQDYVKDKIGPNGEIWKRYKYTIPIVKPIHFRKRSITVDPYILGALIGDGCFRNTAPVLSSNDEFIVNEFNRILDTTQIIRKHKGENYSWGIQSNPPKSTNKLRQQLIDLKLWRLRSENKFIPQNYLFNTIEVRLAILQGLLDTDGSGDKERGCNFRFYNSSKQLIEDVKFLIRSLGGVCFETTPKIRKDRNTLPEHCVIGQLPDDLEPFRLPRKTARVHQREKKFWNLYRSIANIEYVGKKEAQCITVEALDGLYVTDDFIVTHNSLAASNEVVKMCLENPGIRACWTAPTYKQTSIGADLIFDALKSIKVIKQVKKTAGQITEIVLINESKVYFFSATNPDNIRGHSFHFLVVDEFAFIPKVVWESVLRPCLSDTSGRALFISTPFGRGLFWDLFQLGKDPLQTDFESFNFPTSSNPYIPKEDIEQARLTLPHDVFNQEYLAEFLESGAGVFRGIKDCIRGTLLTQGITERHYVLGVDFAKASDFTVIVGMDRDSKQVVYFDRFNQISWGLQLDRISHAATRFNNAKLVVDSTGIGDPLYEQLRDRGFKAVGYGLNSLPAKNRLVEMLSAHIEQTLITFPEIPEMIAELERYQYNISEKTGKITYSAPEGRHDDCVIALALCVQGLSSRKAFEQFRGPAAVVTKKGNVELIEWPTKVLTEEDYRAAQNKWRWSDSAKSPTY
jgi:Terminase RNaseH-like domain/LAGLIDADG-like domain/Terminase large subunit, T4likevirus-type, N-terminal